MNKEFDKNGYAVLRGFYDFDNDLGTFYREIKEIGSFVNRDFAPFGSYESGRLSDKQRSNFYRALRYLSSLSTLAACDKSLSLCKELGLVYPVIMHSCNIRMDIPQGDKFLFHWHQDLTYLLGSFNALTFWIPLTTVNKKNGSIEVVPGSHKGGVLPVKYTGTKTLERSTVMSPKDIHLKEEPKENAILIDADPGDLVVFSQLLLHRSSPNFSDKSRWVIQLRYADVMDKAFFENDYPFGDSTNVFHTNYLQQDSK